MSGGLQPSSMSATSSAAAAAAASAGAAGGNTSWASAASKGLPPSSDPGANANGAAGPGAAAASASTSKQLEQLNSVREALFSQDGWGGSNVKQDTSWDVDQAPGAPGGTGGGSGRTLNGGADAPSAAAKETNMWGGPAQMNGGPPRNDGTDLWKSTLSGQPMVTKQAPPNPWDHKPQNPTDYKNWGEEDDGGGNHGPSGPANEFWRPDQNQFGEYCFAAYVRR